MERDAAWFAEQRAISIEWAQCTLANRSFVICDTETTGVGPDAEIVELALLFPDGNIHIEQRLKPHEPIDDLGTASLINGIKNEHLADCPTWKDIHHTMRALFYPRTVLTYNADYDVRLLRQTAAAWGLPTPVRIFDCAMLQYARYVGEWNEYRGDFKWQKLPVAEGQVAHGALSDCRSTFALLERMANGL